MKSLIYTEQQGLFNVREIVGYGEESFKVVEIDRGLACDVIIANHYSRKVYNNSYIHLGCYMDGALIGVLQFGHLMNNLS
ncbi:Mom family adenine methylcarbamoylation protein, partial [Salmonella enterica]|uniref:Mom family adenine methylcarbamoylation protein n=1 Tax=Salmonella enterica TaxID=28901 RepID=UPI003F9F44A3